MNSINATELLLQGYNITDNGKASFTVYSSGPGDTYEIGDMIAQDDGLWHDCQGSLPWQLVACAYLLERATSRVGFHFQWHCDDQDPYHAYVILVLIIQEEASTNIYTVSLHGKCDGSAWKRVRDNDLEDLISLFDEHRCTHDTGTTATMGIV
jgi:hypothetical protein